MSEEQLHEVQLWCRADRRTLGLTDHYFQVIGDSEYHLGNYSAPKVLPRGSTKGAHLLCVSLVCSICYAGVLAALQLQEDRRLLAFFPIINCESISTGLSIQSFGLLAVPFVLGSAKQCTPLR